MRLFFTFIVVSGIFLNCFGQPAISLPSGYTWVSGGSSSYQNGPFYTGNASGNTSNCGGTICGGSDTSLGGNFQCSNVPWTVEGVAGANYVQDQEYGNIGTADNNLAGLAVPCNPGVGGTSPGNNWPNSTSETRRIVMTNWNNLYPSNAISSIPLASRTSGTVWIPVSASLRFLDDGIGNGTGAGGDELRLTMIGGDNGSCSTWNITANYSLTISVSGAYGGLSGVNGMKIDQTISQTLTNVPNAVNYAYNATNGGYHSCCNNGCTFQAVNSSWYFPGGTNTSTFGTGYSSAFNVLSALVEDGSTFNVDFIGDYSIQIDRNNMLSSSGDARATMGPGLGGKVELVIAYEIWDIQAPAPVKLLQFNAEKKNQTTVLYWTTLTETNNEGFAVQKSKDGISWNTIDYIAGKGNSLEKIHYSTTDYQPFNGKNLYRLAQNDFDGTVSYSHIVGMDFGTASKSLQLYPNPVKEYIQLQNLPAENTSFEIVDSFGRLVDAGTVHQGSNIDATRLPVGVYVINVFIEDTKECFKFIKIE